MNRATLILGLGKSGLAVARHLAAQGESLILTDQRSPQALRSSPVGPEWDRLSQCYGEQLEWALGGHPLELLERCSRVVVSPGVSLHHPLLVEAQRRRCPLIGEMELAWQSCRRPMVAVTGTNGKSTTCTLLGEMLGARGVVGGNIGTPLLEMVESLEPPVEWVVAEVSSFQLETVHGFRPRIGILTNITPDHLDHHRDLEEYYTAKSRLFARMESHEVAIFGQDDEGAQRMAQELARGALPRWLEGFPEPTRVGAPRQRSFSTREPVVDGVSLLEDRGQRWVVEFREGRSNPLFAWDFPSLLGEHMERNGLAAILGGLEMGVSPEDIQAALRRFQPLHYRMELSGEVDGVKFINDSKATNIASALSSVEAFPGPLCAIVGGKDKGVDYTDLAAGLARSGARVFLIGEAAAPIERCLRHLEYPHVERSERLDQAIPAAHRALVGGGTVLLAPACSSFDQFESAEHRGQEFDRLVRELVAARCGQGQ